MLKKKVSRPKEDLRTEKRIPISLTVNVRYNEKVFSGQTQNISKYGMYIETIGLSGIKEREISIIMAAGGTLHRLEGEIVWINRNSFKKTEKSLQSIGVRLTEAQADYLNYIEYLKHKNVLVF